MGFSQNEQRFLGKKCVEPSQVHCEQMLFSSQWYYSFNAVKLLFLRSEICVSLRWYFCTTVAHQEWYCNFTDYKPLSTHTLIAEQTTKKGRSDKSSAKVLLLSTFLRKFAN